jgi:putative MFS transporter
MLQMVQSGKPSPQISEVDLISARIERLPTSPWHVRARVLVGTATFFDAFDALAVAQALPILVGVWHLHTAQVGLLISIGYVGQLLGALTFGWLAERHGRLPAMATAIAIYSVMSALCGLAPNFQTLLIFRALQGFGLGGEVPIAAAYIAEIARAKGRGRFFLLYENIFSVGVVVTGAIG